MWWDHFYQLPGLESPWRTSPRRVRRRMSQGMVVWPDHASVAQPARFAEVAATRDEAVGQHQHRVTRLRRSRRRPRRDP
jgi:hypothetical protein